MVIPNGKLISVSGEEIIGNYTVEHDRNIVTRCAAPIVKAAQITACNDEISSVRSLTNSSIVRRNP